MSASEQPLDDEQFAHSVVAFDEALSLGLDAGLRQRQRGLTEALALESLLDYQRVVRLLHQLWPRCDWGDPNDAAACAGTTATTWIGRFRIVREIGRGGFGIVYLATDPMLGRHVALKVARAELLNTPAMRRRFLREAQAAARLNH